MKPVLKQFMNNIADGRLHLSMNNGAEELRDNHGKLVLTMDVKSLSTDQRHSLIELIATQWSNRQELDEPHSLNHLKGEQKESQKMG